MASITITFTPPNPAPAEGYYVEYWSTDNTGQIFNTTGMSSPIVISGLPDGKNWEGRIRSVCGFKDTSVDIPWSVSDTPATSYPLIIERQVQADEVTVYLTNETTGEEGFFPAGASDLMTMVYNNVFNGTDQFTVRIEVVPSGRGNAPMAFVDNDTGNTIHSCVGCTNLQVASPIMVTAGGITAHIAT